MQTICEVVFVGPHQPATAKASKRSVFFILPPFGRALSEQISNDLNMHRFRNPRGSACSHGDVVPLWGCVPEALKAAAFGPRGSGDQQTALGSLGFMGCIGVASTVRWMTPWTPLGRWSQQHLALQHAPVVKDFDQGKRSTSA